MNSEFKPTTRAADCVAACLLFCFTRADEILLLKRRRQPNCGLWSPAGGKIDFAHGESPYACALREAREELAMALRLRDLHLAAIVTETAEESGAHWLMFLFEVKKRLTRLPPPHPEGEFGVFPRESLRQLPLPATDREKLWPLFWKYRGGFFSAHCQSHSRRGNRWQVEEAYV